MLKPLRSYASGTILAFLMHLVTAPVPGLQSFVSSFLFLVKEPLPVLFHDALPLKLAIYYFNEILFTSMDGFISST